MLMRKPWPGVLIRLHALGDFYSPAYVEFWRDMLAKHPRLSIFGYTAHPWWSPIGAAIEGRLHRRYGLRAMIRHSGGRDKIITVLEGKTESVRYGPSPAMATVSIKTEANCPPDAFVCPEQTGKTRCCATCAACWGTTKNVAFLGH